MTHSRTQRLGLSLFPVLFLLLVAAGGCSKHRHEHHDHGGTHAHQAPHGGALFELGDHQFNLELVHDRTAGSLTAYVLDGHAENAVRIVAPTIPLLVDRDGRTETLALAAVANSLSGETVGNTSEFTAEADWLKDAGMVSGKIAEITVRGTTYRDVPFVLW